MYYSNKSNVMSGSLIRLPGEYAFSTQKIYIQLLNNFRIFFMYITIMYVHLYSFVKIRYFFVFDVKKTKYVSQKSLF
jgi:hypothetical protein